MVHVNFIHKETTVIMKDAKVTFADMLGNIGGTLGVFIGLSFVGLLDFFIWIWDWVKGLWYFRYSKETNQHEVYIPTNSLLVLQYCPGLF